MERILDTLSSDSSSYTTESSDEAEVEEMTNIYARPSTREHNLTVSFRDEELDDYGFDNQEFKQIANHRRQKSYDSCPRQRSVGLLSSDDDSLEETDGQMNNTMPPRIVTSAHSKWRSSSIEVESQSPLSAERTDRAMMPLQLETKEQEEKMCGCNKKNCWLTKLWKKIKEPSYKKRLASFKTLMRRNSMARQERHSAIFQELSLAPSNSPDEEPMYLAWKKVFSRMINRWKVEKKSAETVEIENKSLAELKEFLIRRHNRRIAGVFMSRNLQKLYGIFDQAQGPEDKRVKAMMKKRKTNKSKMIQAQIDSGDVSVIHKCIIFPTSSFRQRWDILIIFLVLYNVMVIPMEIGIGLQPGTEWSSAEYFVDSLFALDIVLNFRTGFLDNRNKLIMEPYPIAVRYLKGWFIIDVLATFPFEIFAVVAGIDAGSSVRLFAALKCPRLLRLGRILKFLDNMRGANVWRMIRLFILFFMMSHWIGCLWYLIAVDESKVEGIDDAAFNDKYLYAVFNGLLMLVGEGIGATINREMLFIIICLAIGQGLSATIFGSMASLIRNLDQGHDLFRNKMDEINQHLRDYQISDELSESIRNYYEYIWMRHRDLIYGTKHLNQMAKNLEDSLCKHKYRNMIRELDFAANCDDTFLAALVINLRPYVMTPGQIISFEGEVSKGMYIIQRGIVEMFNNETKQLYDKKIGPNYFGIEVLNLKTARNWCSTMTRSYCDLHILPIDAFYIILHDFPSEAETIRRIAVETIFNYNILSKDIFPKVKQHSSRSVGANFEATYTPMNIICNAMWNSAQQKITQSKYNFGGRAHSATRARMASINEFETESESMTSDNESLETNKSEEESERYQPVGETPFSMLTVSMDRDAPETSRNDLFKDY